MQSENLLIENQSLQERVQQLEQELASLRRDGHSERLVQEKAVDKLQRQLSIEEELSESQERFVTVFEESRLANKIINPDLKMVQINQALCTMLGYTREEILNTTILEYTHPDFVKVWHDLHEALWKKELPSFQLEACLIRKDKSQVWVLVNTIRFRNKGETLGYTSLVDITERKQLDRHKDEFISTISHELKTPLTSIKGYSQMLLRYFESINDHAPKELILRLDSKVNSLNMLIKDLVMASKIEGGKLTPRSEIYSLDGLIYQIVRDYRQTVSKRDIVISNTVAVNTKGDQFKIGQVVENLLTNAVKFSKENTEIQVSIDRKGSKAYVCIRDYGRGIATESLENIFKRFYKVKEAESNVEAGMGLGLYICKEILSSQQGEIWVESELNKGSMFCFSLPVID